LADQDGAKRSFGLTISDK